MQSKIKIYNIIENIENKIVIYQAEDGKIAIDVRLENETVWLTTNQMALLFDREESNIRRHIINVFKENELSRENNVHFLHVNGVKKPVPFYSLDVIISVGYRVKSQRGTQFRIWANSVLKQMLVKGFAVSNKLTEQKFKELSQVVQLLGRTIETHRPLSVGEYESLFGVVADYSYALQTLDKYDYQQLSVEATTAVPKFHATYENAMETIHRLKERFAESRPEEKDVMVKVVVNLINQNNG